MLLFFIHQLDKKGCESDSMDIVSLWRNCGVDTILLNVEPFFNVIILVKA